MKTRRHHNNDGRRQIKLGRTREFIARLAKRLGIPTGAQMPSSNRCHKPGCNSKGRYLPWVDPVIKGTDPPQRVGVVMYNPTCENHLANSHDPLEIQTPEAYYQLQAMINRKYPGQELDWSGLQMKYTTYNAETVAQHLIGIPGNDRQPS